MKLFKNRKWGKIIYTGLSISIILLIIEIIPGISEQVQKWVEYHSIKREVQIAKNSSFKIDQLSQQNRYLRQTLTRYLSHNKQDGNISDVILYLNNASTLVGAKIIQIQPGKLFVKNDLEIINVNISINAGYESIYNFLRKLEVGDKIIIINEIEIKQNSKTSSDLNLVANLDFYTNS